MMDTVQAGQKQEQAKAKKKEKKATKKKKEQEKKKAGADYYATMYSVRRTYTEEVKAKMGRLDELIGEAHYLSVGNYKEQVIREQVERVTPRKYSVNTGFVISHQGGITRRSKQMDILVWDSTNFAPIFKASDFVVIRPQSLRAAIEVKGVLDHEELNSAFDNLESLTQFTDEMVHLDGLSAHERFPFVRFLVAGAIKVKKDGNPVLQFPDAVWNKLYSLYSKDIIEGRWRWCKLWHDFCPMAWINGIAVVDHGYISAALDVFGTPYVTYQLLNQVDIASTPPQGDDSIGLLSAHLEVALSTPRSYAHGVVARPYVNTPQLVLPKHASVPELKNRYTPREPSKKATTGDAGGDDAPSI